MSLATVGWLLVAVIGFAIALSASRRVADHAISIVQTTNISPFVVGLVVLSVGTDLPEIVNSIITSASGHGDLNVGDSIGSAMTQLTLVLGLLPFFTRPFRADTRSVHAIGGLTLVALLIGVLLVGDGDLDRLDGALLVSGWVVAIYLTRNLSPRSEQGVERRPGTGRVRHIFGALWYLAIVGAGSALAVVAMIEIAKALAVPEYVVAFFGASIGTSLPELIVDITVIRRGATSLAVGDLFGSSLVDSTLSIGIGPLLFPTIVDATQAVRGALFAAVAIALATLLIGWVKMHNRRSGLALVVVYALSYVVLLR